MKNLGCLLGLLLLPGFAAAIVIPNLLTPTCRDGNATAAIATLRNLASCQEQFRAAGRADIDGDGVGEYGTFGELTGTDGVRADAAAANRGDPLTPPILSPALAAVSEQGIVTKSGYAFRIHLPGPRGTATREGKAGWHTGGPAFPG